MSDVIEVVLDNAPTTVIEVIERGLQGSPGGSLPMPSSTMLGNLEETTEIPQNLSAIQVRQWLDAPTNEDLTYYTLLSSFSSFVTWTEDELALKVNADEIKTFEAYAKNLFDCPIAATTRTGERLDSVTYQIGSDTYTKTLNYTGDKITSVVLSGSIPSGIPTTKTITYTGDYITGTSYS